MRRPKPESSPLPPAGEVAHGAGEGTEPSPEPAATDLAEGAKVRTAALALLAGRDFSRHELAQRLKRKGHEPALIEVAIARLEAEGLLREARFVEQFVAQHSRRGRGPVRIRVELREKGVTGEVVDEALEASESDWIESARAARRRKFGASPPRDMRERAKQARFLQYRGFSSTQIRAALGPGEDEPDHDP